MPAPPASPPDFRQFDVSFARKVCPMNARASSNPITRAVVTVAEMSRMVGLSRARFYQLQRAGVFPPPCYSLSNRRPVYVEDQQQACLEVRRRNCGINGVPVLFYARRLDLTAPRATTRSAPPSRAPRRPTPDGHDDMIEALAALGLSGVTGAQVESALRACFPGGINGAAEGQVLRSVFVHLRQGQRQNSGGSVAR